MIRDRVIFPIHIITNCKEGITIKLRKYPYLHKKENQDGEGKLHHIQKLHQILDILNSQRYSSHG